MGTETRAGVTRQEQGPQVDQAGDASRAGGVSPAAGGAQPQGEHRTATGEADCGSGPYLESKRNIVDGREVLEHQGETRLRCKGCKCSFCPRCAEAYRLKVLNKVRGAVEEWSAVTMLTLTVDPKLFQGPEQAFRHVMKERAIGELVRALFKAGVLASKRFFYVVEFHKNGWAHWHLLVEADHVPFKLLAQLWGRNRPEGAPVWNGSYAGSLRGLAPEFGTVRVSQPTKFNSHSHAVNYACKYLSKPQEGGFPPWVLSYEGQLRRNGHSRGLFKNKRRRAPEEPSEAKPAKKRARTIGERIAGCGQECVLQTRDEYVLDDGEVITRTVFVDVVRMPWVRALEVLGQEGLTRNYVILRPEHLERIRSVLGEGSKRVRTSGASQAA